MVRESMAESTYIMRSISYKIKDVMYLIHVVYHNDDHT